MYKLALKVRVALAVFAAMCVAWVGMPTPAAADEVEEWLAQSRLDLYYSLPVTARELGMGRAVGVTSHDIANVFSNPAGLGFARQSEVGITYFHDELTGEEVAPIFDKVLPTEIRPVDGDKDGGDLRLVLPCYSRGVFGFGVSYNTNDYGNTLNSELDRYILNAGYGYAVNDCFSIGYHLSYFNDEVEEDFSDYEMDDGFRHTFGLQLRPCASDAMVFGLQGYFAHGNPETEIDGFGDYESDRKAWGLEFGYGWQVLECTLLAASIDYQDNDLDGYVYDAAQEEPQSIQEEIKGWGVHVGVEQNWRNCLLGRVGYRFQQLDYEADRQGEFFRGSDDFAADYHAVTTGMGWNIRPCLTLDWGMEYRFIGDGDINNTVTARFHF